MMWLGVVVLFIFITVAYLIYTAPEGYEDDDGFHYGPLDDPGKDFF